MEKSKEKDCGCDHKVDEISTTSAVAPVTVPLGKKPNYGGKSKKSKDVEVWDDQRIMELKEGILNTIKKIK